jgi:hypothetical protein
MRRGPKALAGWLDAGRPEDSVARRSAFIRRRRPIGGRERYCRFVETMSCSPVSVEDQAQLVACLEDHRQRTVLRANDVPAVGRRA